MRKFMKLFLLCIALTAALVTMSCRTTSVGTQASVQVVQTIHGSIQTVDKYGNVSTDITVEAMDRAGYAKGDILSVTVGDVPLTAPYVDTYSDVDRGEYLVRSSGDIVALAISYGNFATKTGSDVGTPITLVLSAKEGYLAEYEIRHLEKSQERADYSSDEVFANFRPINAGHIAPGRVYRSANPVLEDARAPYAAKLTEQAKIKTVLNLADSEESMAPHLAAVPYYQQLVAQGSVITLSMGVDFYAPDFIARLKDGLVFMIAHEGPYLIHCNEGKDRAGMVAAVLSALMDASMEEIVEDYMLSYENYFHVEKGTRQYAAISTIIVDLFTEMNGGVPVSDPHVRHVVEGYLENTVGLTKNQIARLKDRLS